MTDIPQMLIEQESDVDNRVLSLTLEAPEADLASLLDIKPNDPVVCFASSAFRRWRAPVARAHVSELRAVPAPPR